MSDEATLAAAADAAPSPEPAVPVAVPAPESVVKTLLTDEQATGATETDGQTDNKAAKVEAEVPEKYDLKVPEGFALDETLMTQFTPLAQELKLSQEGAQKVADLYTTIKRAEAVQAQQAWTKQLDDWGTASRLDPEIGGVQFEANIQHAQKALKTFAPELSDVLRQTGMGNHPAVVKAFVRIGKQMAEATFHSGAPSPASEPEKVMFPNTK